MKRIKLIFTVNSLFLLLSMPIPERVLAAESNSGLFAEPAITYEVGSSEKADQEYQDFKMSLNISPTYMAE